MNWNHSSSCQENSWRSAWLFVSDVEPADIFVVWSSPDYCICCEGLEGWSVVAVGTLQSHNPANPDLEEAPLGTEMPKRWAFMSSRSQAGFRMQEARGISFPVPVGCFIYLFFPLFAMPFHMSVRIKVSVCN